MTWTTTGPVAFALTILSSIVAARAATPDQVNNVQKAAAEIAAIQAKNGADGAFAAINECYKRELAHAAALTPGLEACLAQDMIVSKITAAVYTRRSAEGLRIAGGAEPDAVIKAMTQRVVGTFVRFKVSEDDVLAFGRIVQTQGMEAYGKQRFPNQFPANEN
jgi:hypothetical protein